MISLGINQVGKGKTNIVVYDNNKVIGSVRLKKKKDIKKIKRNIKIASRLFYLLFLAANIAFMIWVFVSWVNVVMNNTSPDGQIAAWNAFELFVKYAPK